VMTSTETHTISEARYAEFKDLWRKIPETIQYVKVVTHTPKIYEATNTIS
jgi:hypothetical protein